MLSLPSKRRTFSLKKLSLVALFVGSLLAVLVARKIIPLPLPHTAHAQATLTGITVTTPSLGQAWSGTVNITVALNAVSDPSPGATNIIRYIIDGETTIMPFLAPPASTLNIPDTLNTTKLSNGQHTLFINVQTYSSPLYGYYSPIGTYGPVTFTVNNGHTPFQLRANYDELWLILGQTVQLMPKLEYTDNTSTALAASSVNFTSASTTVASVDTSGNVTGNAIGDTAITLSYGGFTQTTLVHVNDINATPHFGNDGSELTSYVPGKSMFVNSLFFLGPTTDPQLISDMKAAGINTFETGFYSQPSYPTQGETQVQYQATENSWESEMQSLFFQPVQNMVAQGFSVLFTGDPFTRSAEYLYESAQGWSASWSPNPITYAMTWAKNLGHTIGVEMQDEVSSSWGNNPLPQGQLGQPGGPQQIACVSDTCTVIWPNGAGNGAGTFLITGAVSNPNLNRVIANLYHVSSYLSNGFTFTSAGVGTQTFTPQTDPNLVIQAFAVEPEGPYGPNVSGYNTDYIHNNALGVLMNDIDNGPHPPITWPVAGDDWAGVGPWQGNPAMSDFSTLYWSRLALSYPWGPSLGDDQYTFDQNFAYKYSEVQRDKPVLFESGAITQDFLLQYTSLPVVSMSNDTVTFNGPHGVTPPLVDDASTNQGGVSPRFTLSGSSNSGLNSNYYVYAISNANTLKVYLATPTVPNDGAQLGGTLTFPDGVSTTIYDMNPSGLAITTPNCPAIQNEAFGQVVTITGNSDPAYNGYQWYIPKNSYPCGGSGPSIEQLPSGSGTGGTAEVIYNNQPPVINDGGQIAMTVENNIVWAAAKGMAGVRIYGYSYPFDGSANPALLNYDFPGSCTNAGLCGVQSGVNPRYNGPNATAAWNAMSNAFNLINDISSYLLQPKMQSPDYGPTMVTTARTSSYGKMLMIVNMSEQPSFAQTIDLSPYNPSGGTGMMYTMTAASLNQTSVSGLSDNVTFSPGETVVFTFPPGASDTTPPSISLTSPASGTMASGTVIVSANASDNVGVSSVQFLLDNASFGAPVTTPPYQVFWNTLSVATGTHTLAAKASDAAGNTSTTPPVTVTVTRGAATSTPADTTPPTASITSPVSGVTVGGTINITVSASDNVGVTKVELYVDGTLTGTDSSSLYGFSFDTTSLSNGSHSLSVKAYDASGNIGVSPTVSVTVTNVTQALTASLAPSLVTGVAPYTLTVTATAGGSASGTISYIFYCNRADTGTNITSPSDLTINAATTSSYTAQNVCTYQNPGSYLAKVVIERGSASPAQAQSLITVTAALGGGSGGGGGGGSSGGGGGSGGGSSGGSSGGGGGGGPAPSSTPPSPTPTSTTPIYFTRTLQLGSTGSDVALLAEVLQNLGFLPKTIVVTTTFTTDIQHAVILFQNAHNLAKTGALDPQSQALMNKVVAANPALGGSYLVKPAPAPTANPTTTVSIPAFTRNLTVGSTGTDVTALQVLLVGENYLKATPTGYFGNLTRLAVMAFQQANNISPVSGFVGPLTRAKLNELAGGSARAPITTPLTPGTGTVSFAENLSLGSSGSEVTLLQQKLTNDGDYAGPVTGYYGVLTEQAVETFQAKYGIISYGTPDTTGYGAVGPKTRVKLEQ